jgi:hypothetical protein
MDTKTGVTGSWGAMLRREIEQATGLEGRWLRLKVGHNHISDTSREEKKH